MLKKVLNLVVLFVVVVAVFTPVSDSIETAVEMTIPTIIGIAIARLYFRDILTVDNSAVRIKNILSAVSSLTALVLLAAVCMVEIEALDYTYIELDDAPIQQKQVTSGKKDVTILQQSRLFFCKKYP